MKNYIKSLAVLAALALGFVSCEQASELDGGVSRIAFEQANYEIGAEGGELKVSVLADVAEWNAYLQPATSQDSIEGISISETSGKGSKEQFDLVLNFEKNEGYDRSVVLYLTDGGVASGATIISQLGSKVREMEEITVAEFLKKDVDASLYYKIKGVVGAIANDLYSNFDLIDLDGGASVYIYGLGYESDPSDSKVSLLKNEGVNEGDIITIATTRSAYNGAPQGGKSYYISHEKSQSPSIKLGKEKYYVSASGEEITLSVNSNLVSWTLSSDVDWLSFDPATGSESADVKVTVAPGNGGEGTITLSAEGLDPVTCVVARGGDDVTSFAQIIEAGSKGVYNSTDALVVAVGSTNTVVYDGTAYMFMYDGGKKSKVGDKLTLFGEVTTYNGCPEWNNPSITVASSDNEVKHPEPVVLDEAAIAAYSSKPVVEYAVVEGVRNGYNIEVGGRKVNAYANGSKMEDGKKYKLYGYTIGWNSKNSCVNFVVASYSEAGVEETKKFELSTASDEVESAAGAKTFQVVADEDVNWTVSIEPEATVTIEGLEPNVLSASGTKNVTINYVANTGSAAVSYVVKVVTEATVANSTLTYTLTQKAPVAAFTSIAGLKALLSGTKKEDAVTVSGVLTDAVVTYVNGSEVFIEDETAGVLLYLGNSGFKAGQKINGAVTASGYLYSSLPELISLSAESIEEGGDIPCNTVTLAELATEEGYAKWECRRVKVEGAKVERSLIGKKNDSGSLSQNGSTFGTFNKAAVTVGGEGDVIDLICYPAVYNTNKQVYVYGDDAIVVKSGVGVITMESSKTLNVNGEVSLGASVNSGAEISYESSNTSVATVDANGLVKAIAVGTATITATAPANGVYSAASATCEVTVVSADTPVAVVKEVVMANLGWSNAEQYLSLNIDENVTASLTGTPMGNNSLNTGKYYTNGTDWRIYQNESPALTFTAASGYVLKSVVVTYNAKNGGVLCFGSSKVTSGQEVSLSGSTAVFTVGNTGSATNGQVKITKIKATYEPAAK